MEHKIIYPLLGILSTVVISGCATAPMQLTEQDSSSMVGEKLTVIYYEPDPFLPMTNTKGAFALVGVAAAVSEGKKIVEEKGLSDPAIAIKNDLAKKLSETYQISDITMVPDAKPYESDPVAVSSMSENQGIVLDVRTFGWGTMYYPFKTKYKVTYFAQARLINAKENRLISTERCTIDEKYSENSPSYDELMENDATLLKKKLEDASRECVNLFAQKMGISTTANLTGNTVANY